jgi:hypothetical protein
MSLSLAPSAQPPVARIADSASSPSMLRQLISGSLIAVCWMLPGSRFSHCARFLRKARMIGFLRNGAARHHARHARGLAAPVQALEALVDAGQRRAVAHGHGHREGRVAQLVVQLEGDLAVLLELQHRVQPARVGVVDFLLGGPGA